MDIETIDQEGRVKEKIIYIRYFLQYNDIILNLQGTADTGMLPLNSS